MQRDYENYDKTCDSYVSGRDPVGINTIKKILEENKCRDVLDFGSGTCNYANSINGYNVTCIDNSK